MSIINRLFCDFLVPDSLFVMLFLLGSFLLGLLLGWMLWGEKIKKFITDLATANGSIGNLQAELSSAKDKLALCETDLAKSGKDMQDIRVAFRSLQAEKGQIEAYHMTATESLSKANAELEDLRTQLAESISTAEASTSSLNTAKAEADAAWLALASATAAAKDNENDRNVSNATAPLTFTVEEIAAPAETEVYEEEGELRMFEPIHEPAVAESITEEPIIEQETTEEETTVTAEEAPADQPLLVSLEPDVVAEPLAVSEEPIAEVSREIEAPIAEVNVEAIALDEIVEEPTLVAPIIETTVAEDIAKPKLVPPAGMRLNDLKVVEGIGPKVSGLLHESGVYTWADLAAKAPDELQEILNKGGDRFRLLNPASWPTQAEMLAAGRWQDFKDYTQFLVAGVAPKGAVVAPADDTRRRLFVSPKGWRSDDLKVIEGIGPKIEQLIKDAGIHYWAELSETPPSKLREILAGGGERFQMHDPTTWPDQAKLLANEQWDNFDEFVKYLNRGRTPN